ncbi:NAD(P)-binding protein [Aureobasidium namibiae CBS 147.97]|uniref:NAD(P)-binding protein n=1 Tax=Aureobasidium namibiae CBS 147.97 TaxID=1043004 RepID=A0A074X0I0_9PEZI|nr:NAD(P)-binding protein [Aureobasidium namibiae CBS 147.97]KEQ68111.1 NAD(P)-binding protein [Aureobasidium namibiae CBS 147.97]
MHSDIAPWTTTNAMVLMKPGQPMKSKMLKIRNLAPDQVLVELKATGICHTDLTVASGNFPLSTPAILGHEGAGVVKAVGGKLINRYQPGDTVILSFNSCGQCHSCDNGSSAYCRDMAEVNLPHTPSTGERNFELDGIPVCNGFFGQSSFSRMAIVDERSIVKIPGLTSEELVTLAPLGCGIQTGAGAVINNLSVTPESSFAVIGAGAVGLSGLMAAKSRGAGTIIAIDLLESKLELAKELGATHVFNGKDPELVEKIVDLTPKTGGIQFVLDTTGVPRVLEQAVTFAGIRGRICTVGLTVPGTTMKLDFMDMMHRGKVFTGSIEGDSDPQKFIPFLVDEFRAGRLPLEKIVRLYRFEEFQDAWEDLANGRVIKPIIRW